MSTKSKKDKPIETDLPLLKNDITKKLRTQKPLIHCSNMKSGSSAYILDIFILTTKLTGWQSDRAGNPCAAPCSLILLVIT